VTETTSEINIAAAPATIYRFASATERWPELLPYYRSVRILAHDGPSRTLAMAARRGIIPISWVAQQTDDPQTPSIRFVHLAGPARGMDVVWRFLPESGGTRVTIEHRLQFSFPLASDWLGEHVVAGFFIDYVARRTLACMKALSEAA